MASITLTQINNGDSLDATSVNNNFTSIANAINGGLDDTNVKSAANINGSKLLSGTVSGYLASATNTVDFNTTTVGSDVDVTGLSFTITVPSLGTGKYVKLSVFAKSLVCTAAAGTTLQMSIKEGSTTLAQTGLQVATNQAFLPGFCMVILTPTAGSHTYKVAIQQAAAGTLTLSATSTSPALLLAEII